MSNKKGCYLVWLDGHLTCTVQHRDYSKCDLNRPPEASEGKPRRFAAGEHMADCTDEDKEDSHTSCMAATPSALPTACSHCWNGKLKKRLESTGEIELTDCTYCDGTGVEAQPQESELEQIPGAYVYRKPFKDKQMVEISGEDFKAALAAEYTRGRADGLNEGLTIAEKIMAASPDELAVAIQEAKSVLQQLTKEPK